MPLTVVRRLIDGQFTIYVPTVIASCEVALTLYYSWSRSVPLGVIFVRGVNTWRPP
jgi:hypothetical protein